MIPTPMMIKKSNSDSFLSESVDTFEEAPKPKVSAAAKPPKKLTVRSMSMACLSEMGQEAKIQQPASAKSEMASPCIMRELPCAAPHLNANRPAALVLDHAFLLHPLFDV